MRWTVISCFLCVGLAVVSAFSAIAEPARFEHPLDEVRLKAADCLRRGIDAISSHEARSQQQRETILNSIHDARRLLGDGSLAAERLDALAEQLSSAFKEGNQQEVQKLCGLLRNIYSDLRFRPRKEAELPAGFPPPTPVGEIEVKHYPTYRKASTDGNSNLAFWVLFRHITSNSISMTAPVEMLATDDTPENIRFAKMGFLYESPDLGQLGTYGKVEVSDAPAMTVVSIGVRGRQSREAVVQARKTLSVWLESHQGKWTAVGPLRVMGYNSPFVPREENYFEVQIGVAPAGAEASAGVGEQNQPVAPEQRGESPMGQTSLKVGAKAPAFSLANQDGKTVSLKELVGKWVVVYFYPKDDTPGCTTEACEFTEQLSHFDKLGATVLGISPDSVESHQKFRAKHKLQVELLSDPDSAVAKKYGAWGEKSMYGKTYEGIIRSTVLIGPDGKIAYIWPKVSPAGHAEEVRKKLAELQSSSTGEAKGLRNK